MAIVISPEDDGMSLLATNSRLNGTDSTTDNSTSTRSGATMATASSSDLKPSWCQEDAVDRRFFDEGWECMMSLNSGDRQTSSLPATRTSWSNVNEIDTSHLQGNSYSVVPVPNLLQDSNDPDNRQFAFESHLPTQSQKPQNRHTKLPFPQQIETKRQLIRPTPLRIEDSVRALYGTPKVINMTAPVRATLQVAKQPQQQRSRAIKIRRPRHQIDDEANALEMNRTLYDTATWRMYHRIVEHRQRYPVDYDATMDSNDSNHAHKTSPNQAAAVQHRPAVHFVLQRPEMEGEIFHLEL